jgi:hypothetical protein
MTKRSRAKHSAGGSPRVERLLASAKQALERLANRWRPAASDARESSGTNFFSESRLEDFYRELIHLVIRDLVKQMLATRGWLTATETTGSCAPFWAASPALTLADALPAKTRESLDDYWQELSDSRNQDWLTTAELGALYEGLLSQRLTFDAGRQTFTLEPLGKSTRRKYGSYYTPPALVECVLAAALDPIINAAVQGQSGEAAAAALLALRVCDPACGSGFFLVAAAQRLATRLAEVRVGGGLVTDSGYRGALAEVVAHCMYGVDLDPLAVELTKLCLWLEVGDPHWSGRELHAHVRTGNSLLSATPERVALGIPATAFKPGTADDSETCRRLRRINKRALPHWTDFAAQHSAKAASTCVADAWCASFVIPKDPAHAEPGITNQTLEHIALDPSSLSPPLREVLSRLRAKYRFFHWEHEFPEVFTVARGHTKGGFDVVLGNPPYRNAIEGSGDLKVKRLWCAITPELIGTADQAYHFAALAHRLAKPEGAVGLILPQAFLSSRSALALRTQLLRERPPSFVYIPQANGFFANAATYVCVVALQRHAGICRFSSGNDTGLASSQTLRLRTADWWQALSPQSRHSRHADPAAISLGDAFEVCASQTVAEAYQLQAWLQDTAMGDQPRLATTRLIDPGTCHWGTRSCRYLGQRYSHPRVAFPLNLPQAFLRRAQQAQRPKILIAGLCNRLEAFCDVAAQYLGAVSTFSVFHPQDDVRALQQLCDWLNSPEANAQMHAHLGAPSVGFGYHTLSKQTLRQLTLPDNRCWNSHGEKEVAASSTVR